MNTSKTARRRSHRAHLAAVLLSCSVLLLAGCPEDEGAPDGPDAQAQTAAADATTDGADTGGVDPDVRDGSTGAAEADAGRSDAPDSGGGPADAGSPDTADAAEGDAGTGDAADAANPCHFVVAGLFMKSMVETADSGGSKIAFRPATAGYVTNSAQRFSARSRDFVALPDGAVESGGGLGQPKTGEVTLKPVLFAFTNAPKKKVASSSIEVELDVTRTARNGGIQGDDTAEVSLGEAKKTSFEASIKQHTASSFAPGTLDRFGTFELTLKGTEGTMFEDPNASDSSSQRWAVPISSLLHNLDQTLSHTRDILDLGFSVSLAITSTIAASSARGVALAAEVARAAGNEVVKFTLSKKTGASSPPTSGTDLAMLTIDKGISAFQKVIRSLPNQLRDEADWAGRAGVGGQLLMRKAKSCRSGTP